MGSTLVMAYYFLVVPVFVLFNIPPALTWGHLAMLVAATLLIAAGGNLLNDYYDVATDAINKPGKNAVGQTIPAPQAFRVAWVLMGLGAVLGSVLVLLLEAYRLVPAFVFPVVVLWLYNRSLKAMAVVGNLLVSFLVAYVLVLLGLLANHVFVGADALGAQVSGYVWQGVGAFAVFAFLTTWVRELIKDIQDMRGDRKAGYRTLPVLIGERTSKFVVIILLLLLFRLILMAQQWYLAVPEFKLPLALLIGTELPLLVCMVLVWRADTPAKYGIAGQVMKLLMVGGIASMVFYELLL